MQVFRFDHSALRRTMGRIDDADPKRPVWVFPYTQVSFRFTGTSLGVELVNHWNYGDIHLGAVIDGMQVKVPVPIDAAHDAVSLENGYPRRVEPAESTEQTTASAPPRQSTIVTLTEHLPNIEHEVTIFKRQDGGMCHLEMLAVLLDDGAELLEPADTEPQPPKERRIEVFGDSVSCGERCEAVRYAGQCDPDADLSSYSNAWYSYAAIAARELGTQLHITAQGGVPLVDGIGWFNPPHYIGMESMWDKVEYNPALGATRPWDFSRYTPHVVVVALGQNDSHPRDFMAQCYDDEQARHWRERYVDFVRALRATYPEALIVLTTTIMQHDAAWDRAIDEVCHAAADPKVTHLLYSRNGSGTPGHPRIAEQREMGHELADYLASFGPSLWD